MNIIWSILERGLPRAASAVIMLLLAAFVVPEVAGIYSSALVLLGFLQALFETPMRQMSVEIVRRKDHRRFLNQYAISYVVISSSLLSVFIIWLVFSYDDQFAPQIWALLLLALLPVCNVFSVAPLAYLQIHDQWRKIARFRLQAVLVAFIVSLPVMYVSRSILGPILVNVISEVVVTLRLRSDGRMNANVFESNSAGRRLRPDYIAATANSVLSWLAGNTDRVVIGFVAGAPMLALYSFAWSLSRAFGDSASVAVGNVLRARLSSMHGEETASREKLEFERLLTQAMLVGFAGSSLMSVMCVAILPRFLKPEWTEAIMVVPVLSMTVVPVLLDYCSVVASFSTGRTKWVPYVRILAIAMAVPIGFAATQGLLFASVLLVIRQLIILCALVRVTRAPVGPKLVLICIAGLVVQSVIAGVLVFL